MSTSSVRAWWSVSARIASMAVLAGCAAGTPMGTPPENAGDGTIPAGFASGIQPIFTNNCAVAGCHAPPDPQQGMDLSPGAAYANVVNVPARELPGMMRVRPFQPDSSYLVHKVQGTQASVGGSGARMPLGAPPLSAQQIAAIRAWISQGAPNSP